ncbi:hypothetical protein TGAM01_v210886, partial [Trichoderma gamsii]
SIWQAGWVLLFGTGVEGGSYGTREFVDGNILANSIYLLANSIHLLIDFKGC